MSRPVVYFSISMFMGCFSALILTSSIFIGAAIAASFFLIIFWTIDKKYFILNILFFIAAMLTFYLYYSLDINSNLVTLRVQQNKGYYMIASYKNRNIILKGNIKNIEEGQKVTVYGKFTCQKDYTKGILGSYYVTKSDIHKKDFIAWLYDIKRTAYNKFKSVLGNDRAGLVMALCVGDTNNISKEQKNQFVRLGIVHAISVSGLHIALIFMLLEKMIGMKFTLGISFVYILFTGFQAATIRSYLMIAMSRLSKGFYKNYDPLSGLGFSAIILLLVKPYYVADIGFMLSFLSTLGIILFNNRIKRKLYFLPDMINDSLSVTLSAQTFSMPYAIITLNNFSMGFILGNLILLPLFSAVLVVGNISILSMSITPIFKFLGFILHIIIMVIEGAEYILLKITPPVSLLTYVDAVAIMCIFMSYILYEKGYKKFKYFPIFNFILVIFMRYNFFPEIQYLQGKNNIIINYKMESISLNSDKIKFNSDIKASNAECIIKSKKEITLDGRYFIKALEDKKGYINLEILNNNKKTLIINNNDDNYNNIDLSKYDIIKIPKTKYSTLQNNNYRNKAIAKYIIIFGKVYLIE